MVVKDKTPGNLMGPYNDVVGKLMFAQKRESTIWRKVANKCKFFLSLHYMGIKRRSCAEKILNWGCRTLLYDTTPGRPWDTNIVVWKFVFAELAAYIGVFLYNGPRWWHRANRARRAARERAMYRTYIIEHRRVGQMRTNGAYAAGDKFKIE